MKSSLFIRTEWGNELQTPLFHKGDIADVPPEQEYRLSGVWVRLPDAIKSKKDIKSLQFIGNEQLAIESIKGFLYFLKSNGEWDKTNLKTSSLKYLAEGVRSYCLANIMSPAYDGSNISLKECLKIGELYSLRFIEYHKKFKKKITPCSLFSSLTLKADINYNEVGDKVFYSDSIFKFCKEILREVEIINNQIDEVVK